MKKYTAPLLLCAVCLQPWLAWAVSKQYTNPGTPLTFADSGQTPAGGGTLVQLTFSGLGTQQGRVSSRADKGAGAQPSLWELRCRVSLTGTNIPGADVQFFIVSSDGQDIDGGVGSVDAAITNDQRRPLLIAGSLVVYQAVSNVVMFASFRNIYIPSRYFSVAVWNNTTLNFQTSSSAHRCVATPMPPEMQ